MKEFLNAGLNSRQTAAHKELLQKKKENCLIFLSYFFIISLYINQLKER